MAMVALKSRCFFVKSTETPTGLLDYFLDLMKCFALFAELWNLLLRYLYFASRQSQMLLVTSYLYTMACACPHHRRIRRRLHLSLNSPIHPVWHLSHCLIFRPWLERKQQGGPVDHE